MSRQSGFSMIEVLLALSLGMLLLLAASRLFIAASQSWQAQMTTARMQEDARLALQRLTQSIRMAGAFGCLRYDAVDFLDPLAAQAFAQPLLVSRDAQGRLLRLSLISAESVYTSGEPDWTLLTDCVTHAMVHAGAKKPADGQFAIPIRRQEYRLVADQLRLRSAASNGVLVEGVSELQLELLRTSTLAVSGVRLSLTLTDPQQRVRPQTYRISVALGNPVDLL
ncbi:MULTISPECIES: PilW family protein [Pseudomonas]|uniref:PilW family protein n=1 Tax=Pseudomonas TaxID=286 RepID=UPI00193E5219|nr:prepilin-type N-terminal cleavage/methylation domain-containing protein [Pseudomonas arcuscaelestis]MBM3111369.1 prepilin-type N-terminal cleavage/methylation domain-containing protein [Pseudomonas arcuscaelestis]